MAAVIALGGAATVFRGARLAYAASMAKVDFDRELQQRGEKRKALGLCLRLDFAINILWHEAEVLLRSIPDGDHIAKPREVQASQVNAREPDALVEAWNNLESIPPWIVEELSNIRISIYDFGHFREVVGDRVWQLKSGDVVPREVKHVRQIANNLIRSCGTVRNDLGIHIKQLGEGRELNKSAARYPPGG
jgi:hypothetical protein